MTNVQSGELLQRDTGGRRIGIERRQFTYSGYIPERRCSLDRRSGVDRRVDIERRCSQDS